MPHIANEARQLWAASFFVRRAKDGDGAVAWRALRHLSRSQNKVIAARAGAVLTERENDC